jgi:hypothetical protein
MGRPVTSLNSNFGASWMNDFENLEMISHSFNSSTMQSNEASEFYLSIA